MYKIASQNRQAAVDRIRAGELLGAGLPEVQTDEQKAENLKRAIASLQPRIDAAVTKAERKALGVQKFQLQEELRGLKPRLKRPTDYPGFFMEAAKSRLTPHLYALLKADADKLWQAEQAAQSAEGAA